MWTWKFVATTCEPCACVHYSRYIIIIFCFMCSFLLRRIHYADRRTTSNQHIQSTILYIFIHRWPVGICLTLCSTILLHRIQLIQSIYSLKNIHEWKQSCHALQKPNRRKSVYWERLSQCDNIHIRNNNAVDIILVKTVVSMTISSSKLCFGRWPILLRTFENHVAFFDWHAEINNIRCIAMMRRVLNLSKKIFWILLTLRSVVELQSNLRVCKCRL